jgi:hypothetical protein
MINIVLISTLTCPNYGHKKRKSCPRMLISISMNAKLQASFETQKWRLLRLLQLWNGCLFAYSGKWRFLLRVKHYK